MKTKRKSSNIAEHLQKRFKERHGIELTRTRRLMLLTQIQNGVAKKLSHTPNGKTLYRVFLYNNLKQANDNFSVIYCPQTKTLLTVLPKQESEEYQIFCKKNRLSLEVAKSRELTAQERTNESIKAFYKYKREQRTLKCQEDSLLRLKEFRNVKRYFQTKA